MHNFLSVPGKLRKYFENDDVSLVLDIESCGIELEILSDTFDRITNDLFKLQEVQSNVEEVAVHDHSCTIPLRKITGFASAIPVLDDLILTRREQGKLVMRKIEAALKKLIECQKRIQTYNALIESFLSSISGESNFDSHFHHSRRTCYLLTQELSRRISLVLETSLENQSSNPSSWEPIENEILQLEHRVPQLAMRPRSDSVHGISSSQSPVLLKGQSRVFMSSSQQLPHHAESLRLQRSNSDSVRCRPVRHESFADVSAPTPAQKHQSMFETCHQCSEESNQTISIKEHIMKDDDDPQDSLPSERTMSQSQPKQSESDMSSQTTSAVYSSLEAVIVPPSEPSESDTPLPIPHTRSFDFGRFPLRPAFDLNSPTAICIPSSSYPSYPQDKENAMDGTEISRAQSIQIQRQMESSPIPQMPRKSDFLVSISPCSTVDTCSHPQQQRFEIGDFLSLHKSQEFVGDSAKMLADINEDVNDQVASSGQVLIDEEIAGSFDS